MDGDIIMENTIIESIPQTEVLETEPIRKMASIQKVLSLTPISFINKETGLEEIADKIECATILGWKVVVKKNEVKINDLAVFFEVGSIIPYNPWNEFLKDKNRPDRPIRLKTCRFKKALSQGLLLPIKQIHQLDGLETFEGMDLTQLLGITKIEDEIDSSIRGMARGNKPNFIPTTDETSAQNSPYIYSDFYGKEIFLTQKIDGQSWSCCYKDNSVHVCSRKIDIKEDETNTFWALAKEHDIPNKLKNIFDTTGIEMCLQGELAGPGIQKNKLGLKKHKLFIFNVINISGQYYYSFDEFIKTCKELDLPTVPILKECIFNWKNIDELLKEAEGKYENGHPQEGIVCKLKNNNNGLHQSFKVISNTFRELTEK